MESDSIISAAALTDHCMVKLILRPTNAYQRRKGYWKFDSNLLHSDLFYHEIVSTIDNINGDFNFKSYKEKWEYLKYKIRQISISYDKLFSRNSNFFFSKLLKKLTAFVHNLS